MSFWETIFVVLGLTMDTLAIASAVALYHPKIGPRLIFRIGHHFSLFQAGLLFLGWWAGSFAERYFSNFDHWIGAGLLWFIGIKMIRESFDSGHEKAKSDPSRGWSLVILSVATSIDAMAVGGSLGLLKNPDDRALSIGWILLITWIITVVIAVFGLFIGKRVGLVFGRRAELAGGTVLCLIGIKVVLAHLSS